MSAQPRHAPAPRRGPSTGVLALCIASIAALSAVIGILVYRQFESKKWQMPTGDDLVHIKDRLLRKQGPTPKVVYLARAPLTLSAGDDDSAAHASSIVKNAGKREVRTRGFSGGNREWKRIVGCVQATFAPFDITITDREPAEGVAHILVAMGGTAEETLGRSGPHVGGLAPFNGELISSAVVFVFSQRLRNRLRPVCNTIAMEVAHAYGLDHAYDCKDVMTYLPDCGPRYFRDAAIPCGEHEPRACAGGKPTQNSFRRLAKVVGLSPSGKGMAASGSTGHAESR